MRPTLCKAFQPFLFVSVFAVSVFTVQAQDSAHSVPAQKPVRPASSKTKVWTNDSLESIRKPWDRYLDQKAAAESTSKANETASLSKTAGQVEKSPALAKTPEEADQQTSALTKGISNRELAIARLQKELENAPEDQRAGLQQQLDLLNAKLDGDREELKILQSHRQELEAAARQGDQTDQDRGQNGQSNRNSDKNEQSGQNERQNGQSDEQSAQNSGQNGRNGSQTGQNGGSGQGGGGQTGQN